MFYKVIYFFSVVFLVSVLFSVAGSLHVIFNLCTVGADFSIGVVGVFILKDLVSLQTIYPFILVCFSFGFLLRYWVWKSSIGWCFSYVFAGGISLGIGLWLMKYTLLLMPLAIGRSWQGQLILCCIGAIGGLLLALNRLKLKVGYE